MPVCDSAAESITAEMHKHMLSTAAGLRSALTAVACACLYLASICFWDAITYRGSPCQVVNFLHVT